MKDTILVTDWERVSVDDFYLSPEWEKEVDEDHMKQARELAKENKLYVAYTVPAIDYAVYTQMDAGQVFIDDDGAVLVNCESAIIGNNHQDREVYGL